MHRLLQPPANRMNGTLRLPRIQNAHGAFTQQFQASLMHFDALRRVKTTAKNRIALGPLASPQAFITRPSGGVNTPGSMTGGLHKVNARRAVAKTRGQSAGIS